MMTVVKADGYGHGMLPGRARAARAGRSRLARRRHDRRGARPARRPATPAGCCAGSACPARSYAAAIDRRRRRHRLLPRRAGRDRRRRPRRPAPGPAAAQGRHRPLPRRRDRRRLAGRRRGARPAQERGDWPRSPGSGRTSPCSDEPDHPANDAQETAFRDGAGVAEEAGLRPEVRHLANSAAAILRPSSRFDLVRCGIASYGLDPAPGHHAGPRAGARDDRPRHPRDGQADRGRRRGLLRPHLGRGPRHHRRAGAGRVRRRRAAARRQPGRGAGSTGGGGRSAAGSAWTSSSSTSTETCPRPAATSCCSAPATTASRPPRTGPRPASTISYEIVTRIGGRMVRRYVARGGPAHLSVARKLAGVAAGAVGVAVAGTAVGGRPARRVIARARRGRRDAVRLAAVRADHGRRRRRRTPPRRGRRVHRPADQRPPALRRGRRPGADRRLRPRLRAQPRLLALPARRLPRAGPHRLLRPALARPLRPLDRGQRHDRPARPRPPAGPRRGRRPRDRWSWSATRWAG